MGKHLWVNVGSDKFCWYCRTKDECDRVKPTTGEGDTKANRAHEAGEVEELKEIYERLVTADQYGRGVLTCVHVATSMCICVKDAMNLLEKLIQKREANIK